MRCYICDVILEPHEIIKDPRTGKFEPCGKCKDESYQGWVNKDKDDDYWEGYDDLFIDDGKGE